MQDYFARHLLEDDTRTGGGMGGLLEEWAKNPWVASEGKNMFDCLEDLDSHDCLQFLKRVK